MDVYKDYITTGLGKSNPSQEKIKQFKKNYFSYFPIDRKSRFLDIGPGKGEMLICLSELGYENLEAVDISESVVEYCKSIGFKNVYKEDVKSFLKEGEYDMITMCDVVEHISKNEICDVVTSIYKALKANGTLIIQTPNMQSIAANIFLHDDFTHVCGYTERSIIQMLTLSGFRHVKCFGFELLDKSFKSKVHSILRAILWMFVKVIRKINGTMPHKIMHPIFFAVATK